jgi:hypothetical protein
MTIGSAFVPDTTAVSINGVISNLTESQMSTQFGASNIKTPTKDFSFAYGGHTLYFRSGMPVVMHAGLQAALTAAAAHIV